MLTDLLIICYNLLEIFVLPVQSCVKGSIFVMRTSYILQHFTTATFSRSKNQTKARLRSYEGKAYENKEWLMKSFATQLEMFVPSPPLYRVIAIIVETLNSIGSCEAKLKQSASVQDFS
jgi:hypothetical protein